MNKIEYGTEFLDQLKDSVHDLHGENKELKKEIERLNKENKELNKICARKSHYIDKKDLEIGRLNNTVNELEKWLEERLENLDINGYDDDVFSGIELSLYKLRELKGVDKE